MKTLAAAALITALSIAAYSNSFQAGYSLDDYHQVVNNQHIRRLSDVPRFFSEAGMGSAHQESKGYRPLTMASFALNYAIGGYKVFGYHLFNLVLHLLNAFLVFLVVGTVLRKAGSSAFYPTSLFVSLAFALHPVQTAAVTYVSGRAVLLAAFFCLSSFLCFLRSREGGQNKGGQYFWTALASVSFLLALLSKEMAVSLVFVVLAYGLIFSPNSKGWRTRAREAARMCMPFLLVTGLVLVLRRAVLGFAAVGNREYGVYPYLMSESRALIMYLRLMFLPVNQNADYGLPPAGSFGTMVAISAAALALVVYLILRLRKGSPSAAFFGLWFIIALLPESTFFPITDIAVEYRLYLPSVGLLAMAAVLAAGYLEKTASKAGLALPALLLLAVLTFNRNQVWASPYTLWSDVVKKSPWSSRAHLNMGTAFLDNKRYQEAARELETALDLMPGESSPSAFKAHNNLGACYYEMGDMEKARSEYEKALALKPDYEEGYQNLGMILGREGRYEEALSELLKAGKVNPDNSLTHYMLAMIHGNLGNGPDALKEISKALKLAPSDFEINYAMAAIYRDNGMADEAVLQSRKALSLAVDEAQRQQAAALLARLRAGGLK